MQLFVLNRFLCLVRFQVYTAKSLFVGGKSGETFDDDDIQLQRLSDVVNETIETKTKDNLLSTSTAAPPSVSSFFSFKTLNLLPFPKRHFNLESTEDDFDNEIESSDVFEIEVPMIGSEYMRIEKDHQADDDLKTSEDVDESKGFVKVDIFTEQPTSDIYTTQTLKEDIVTFSSNFQASNEENTQPTTQQNDVEDTTQPITTSTASSLPFIDGNEETTELNEENYIESFQTIESKLMEHWKPAYDSLIDEGSRETAIESKTFTLASDEARRLIFPFNVKILVNNENDKRSCKTKKSCHQISFSQRNTRDIDPQSYLDYSGEDSRFKSETDEFFKQPDEMKARNARRADDILNFLPSVKRLPVKKLEKPAFIQRLENESSLERSERIDKHLNDLTRFVSVWAQVDKFVSDRTREIIKKVAHLSGDSDYDDVYVGSRRRIATRRANDDPFT